LHPPVQDGEAPGRDKGAEIHRLPAMPLAGYTNVRVAMGGVYRVKRILADYAPDVVHLAWPFVLGWRAAKLAHQLGIAPLPSGVAGAGRAVPSAPSC
jgi:phosphatidylinositol alpha 1,6-mannosyltransferase